ncbi:MAG: DNA polymerase III subunit beta [Oscillospiraceae bacterium]|nr:DNA polymerase III subunit beta [Oscillospiraceae bacterium]
MKFTCEKALLVSALSIAGRTVAQKSSISCLEGILLRVGVGVQLTGFNLETGITVRVDAAVSEPGVCVMPARLFFDIVRKLPDEEVTVSVDERLQVSIRAGVSSFKIAAMDAEEYPDLPDVDSNRGISMPQYILRDMIGGTIFSASENQSRPIHTGCLMEVGNESISMVAVDNTRLARRTWFMEEPLDREMKFVVPATGLREVEKILTDTDETVKFTLGSKHILFEIGEVTLVCRILEGEFIDWRRVVPVDNQIRLVAKVADLMASIERVSLIVSEKIQSPVRCTFGDQVADFRTTNTIGTAHDTCSVAGNGNELEIGFKCRYLLDALKAVPTEEVTLEMKNGLSPIVFTPADGKNHFSYMVLPVRLH